MLKKINEIEREKNTCLLFPSFTLMILQKLTSYLVYVIIEAKLASCFYPALPTYQ